MAESRDESVIVNDMPDSTSNGVIERRLEGNEMLMSAALIVDANDGLVLLSQSLQALDTNRVKLYFLYRHSFCRFLFYLTIALHHLLVLFETTSDHKNHIWINSLEIICLIIYTIRLSHLYLLISSSVFWSDKKNIIVVATIIITFCDIFISYSVNHYIRWTPVLRPLFIINFAENKEIRRTFRNIRNTLPDVLNVLVLFFLSLLTFSIIGLKLFEKQFISSNDFSDKKYFGNFIDVIFNLYVLVTTANNPDLMMPSYNKNGWFAIYFVTFLIINVYLFMNIILAVIYNNYKKHLKSEVKNLLQLKRENILRAFDLIYKESDSNVKTDEKTYGINGKEFNELMQIVLDVNGCEPTHRSALIAIYWSLLETNQLIPKENFCQISDLLNYEITVISNTQNITILETIFKNFYRSRVSTLFRYSVKSKYFRNFFDSLIFLNTLLIAINFDYTYLEWTLLLLFTIEILAKLYTFGFVLFAQKFWNIFDSIVIGMAIILSLVIGFKNNMNQELEQYLDLLLILRVLRLCKIISTIKRFKMIVKTILTIIPSISTYIGLLFVVYYSYSLIGMRLFSRLTNDTKSNFSHCSPMGETTANYCTINFNTFPNAMLFLFDLMVVNQWHVLAKTQELAAQTKLTRLYFVSFHLICVILVLNIFTAFVLEAFILEYIDLTDNKLKKTTFQMRLEQLGVNCLNKAQQPVIMNTEYNNLNDMIDADHDFIGTSGSQTQQELSDCCLSFNYSDLRIIIKEKKSVDLLLIKMFQNDITF